MKLKYPFFFAAVFICKISISQLAIDPFLRSDALDGAGVSLVFFDLVTGQDLEWHNKELKLCPASTWKLLTVATAAEVLNQKTPFQTELVVDGEVNGGVLNGNIIIKGYGDPTLGSEVFDENQMEILHAWAKTIAAEGITRINGKVLADDSWLKGLKLPRTRIWEDMANYYGAHLSGLNFHDNAYTLEFNTEFDPGERVALVNVYPEVPNLNIESEVLASTVGYDRAFIFGSPLSAQRVVRGTLPAGYDRYTIKGSLPDPALFCAYHLNGKLSELGIQSEGAGIINAQVGQNTQVLSLKKSPDLEQIIRGVLVDSNNLYAEALLAKIGEENKNGDLEKGVEKLLEFYSDRCDSGSKIYGYDGSGLSRFNAISAGQFQHLLQYCYSNTHLRNTVLDNLPQFGLDGTVKRMGQNTPLEGNVAAKSGSMTGVLAYTGVFQAVSGRQIGFSILINNYDSQTFRLRQEIEDVILAVFHKY